MKIVKMKVRRANYGKYGKNNGKRFFKATYPYLSMRFFSDEAGVQNKAPGIIIRELREQYDMSRNSFAEFATSQASPFGIKVSKFNIQSYETWHYDMKGVRRHPCCPKIDKLVAVTLAMSALTGKSFQDCLIAMTGYTQIAKSKRLQWEA